MALGGAVHDTTRRFCVMLDGFRSCVRMRVSVIQLCEATLSVDHVVFRSGKPGFRARHPDILVFFFAQGCTTRSRNETPLLKKGQNYC